MTTTLHTPAHKQHAAPVSVVHVIEQPRNNWYTVDLDGRRYQIVLSNEDGGVSQLHRVFPTQHWSNGEFISVYDNYRSISKRDPKYTALVASLLSAIRP